MSAETSAADVLPKTPLQALLMFLATVVAAPICEEVLFRGYLLRAYERLGGRKALVAVALLFALFHLRFQGSVFRDF